MITRFVDVRFVFALGPDAPMTSTAQKDRNAAKTDVEVNEAK